MPASTLTTAISHGHGKSCGRPRSSRVMMKAGGRGGRFSHQQRGQKYCSVQASAYYNDEHVVSHRSNIASDWVSIGGYFLENNRAPDECCR